MDFQESPGDCRRLNMYGDLAPQTECRQMLHNVSKAFKMCGFIKRVCTTFTDVQALQSLYISLVRSQLESCSVIWNPWQRTPINKIKRVKKNSLKISVTNPKYSTPLTIILRFAIILDYRPFNIIGKLQI